MYTEILKLNRLLNERGLPFQMREVLGGYQIGYPSLNQAMTKYSVIEHDYSYGHERDLLEIGWAPNRRVWEIRDHITADDAFRIIEYDYEHRETCDDQSQRRKHK